MTTAHKSSKLAAFITAITLVGSLFIQQTEGLHQKRFSVASEAAIRREHQDNFPRY